MELKFKCANCGEMIFSYDGRQTLPRTKRCPKCNRYMRFRPDILRVEEIEEIPRTTSSGARFY